MKLGSVAVICAAAALTVAMGSTASLAATKSPSPSPSADPAAPAPSTALAQPPLVNEQLVTAALSPSGLPLQAQIVNRIVATNIPAQQVTSQTSTSHIRNLDNARLPEIQTNSVIYSVGGSGQTSAATQASFGKPMPVALHAEYSTAGEGKEGIDPTAVAGTSGEMEIRYTVTNTVVKNQKITYQNAAGVTTTEEQPVFAPFVGTVIAVLAPGVALSDSGTAVVSTTPEGKTALLWNLVLYPPLGNYTQELAFTVHGNDLEVPALNMQVVPVTNAQDPAVGFSSKLLTDSVNGNTKLADGLTEINNSTIKLADGAAQLSVGQQQQADGTASAAEGAGNLTTGSAKLTSGSADLTSGLVKLGNGLDELGTGLEQAEAGAGDLADAVDQIAAAVGNASDAKRPDWSPGDPIPTNMTLVQAVWLAQAGVDVAAKVAASSAADSATAGDAIRVALLSAGCAVPPPPAICIPLATAAASTLAAGTKSAGVAAGLGILNTKLLAKIEEGLIQVGTALKSMNSAQPGVYEGLIQLQEGLVKSVQATQDLGAGADSLTVGSKKLTTGSKDLTAGSKKVTTGLDKLAAGADQLATGSDGLAQGATDLQTQGTEKVLNQVIDSSAQPGLANAYLLAASARATDATPYPPPEGAVARVAYAFTLAPPATNDGPSPEALAIGVLFLVALIMLSVIRIRRRPADPGAGFAPPPAPADPVSAAIAERS